LKVYDRLRRAYTSEWTQKSPPPAVWAQKTWMNSMGQIDLFLYIPPKNLSIEGGKVRKPVLALETCTVDALTEH